MRFGLCCSPDALGFSSPQFHENIERLKESGADYLEFAVVSTTPEGDERDFEALRTALENAALSVEAFNSFVPKHHRLTGPDVELGKALKYCDTALARCRALGADVVVLGSAGARSVPAGFSAEAALGQFTQFCRELGPIAQAHDVTICLEPLNAHEDNLLLSVRHGAQLVDEVAHPHIQLLADLYHIEIEGEALDEVAMAGGRLRHTHVADVGRVAPGYAQTGEADFRGFFAALNRAGYDSSTHSPRCSFEGSYQDLFEQAEPLLRHLKERAQQARA